MHAHTNAVARPRRRAQVDLQLELTLLDGLTLSPEIARSASTPTLRRLIARSRIGRLRLLLGEPAPSAQLSLPMRAALAADARKAALLEATLLPLVGTRPADHPELHSRLRLATQLSQLDLCLRGGWRRLEQLALTTPPALRGVWNAALWDVLAIEATAWREQAAELLPGQVLEPLTRTQRHNLWVQAHAQHHPAAPRLWMWMTLLATLDDRKARSQPVRAPIPFV